MIYKITFPAEGHLFIHEPSVMASRGPYTFELLADPSGRVGRVSVATTVPPDKVHAFQSTIRPSQGDVKAAVAIGGDRGLHKELIAQLQVLESDLSFVSGSSLYGLRWSNPEASFIPQNPQEEELLAVSSFSFEHEYPHDPVFITRQALAKVVADAPDQADWLVHKAIFREAMTFFRTFKYVQAFYGFYFILEDLFIHGKSREAAALKEIANSSEFPSLAREAFDSVMSNERHKQNIETLCRQLNLAPSPEIMPKLLFRARGTLHHFHKRSSRPQPVPFRQDDFESIAFLAMEVSTRALADRAFTGYGLFEGVQFPD